VVGETSGSALEHWREELEAWAIPDEIIERAPESPWGFPVGMFRAKAEQARGGEPTPSNREALRFLGEGGTVLDVGAGAGAASLPLAGSARRIMAVDESPGMIEAFLAAAVGAWVEAGAVHGRWPDVAGQVDPADVVVCNDVLYNVQDLGPFAPPGGGPDHQRPPAGADATAVAALPRPGASAGPHRGRRRRRPGRGRASGRAP
jgi:SAM-dependent methyltransferase